MKGSSVVLALVGLLGLSVGVAPIPAMGAETGVQKPAAGVGQENARAVIAQFDDTLLNAMKGGKKLGYTGRYKLLAPVVERSFHFSRIAALTLGSYWEGLTPAQKETFVSTLRDFTTATYAARFDAYSGERFAIQNVQLLQPGVMAVYSTFTESDGKVHHFDYLLQDVGGQWRIVNVVADGVSDLSMKRVEYMGLMKSKGFAGLIDNLKGHIEGLARGQAQ